MASRADNKSSGNQQNATAQPVYVAAPSTSDEGIDLLDLWITLWNGKWLIIAITIAFAVFGIVYSLSVTPVYRAEIILAPVSRGQSGGLSDLGGLASLAGIRIDSSGDGSQSIAILHSKSFIAEFIKDKELLPVLFPDEWDAENRRWTGDDQVHRDIRDGVKVFIEDVRSISENQETGLVTLGVEWTDPKISAKWATELVERINERMRRQDIEESHRKLAYLNKELEKANLVELRLAISRVIEEQVNAMMLAQSQIEYAFEVIDPAVVPKQRVRPRRTIIVIVATFLGGIVGVFILLGRFSINRLAARAAERGIG